MRTSTVEALVWVLIYGGLLLLCLGLFVLRSAPRWAGHLVLGLADVVAGPVC
jgi:hypothetical protein